VPLFRRGQKDLEPPICNILMTWEKEGKVPGGRRCGEDAASFCEVTSNSWLRKEGVRGGTGRVLGRMISYCLTRGCSKKAGREEKESKF